jgi:hypothetical protein
MYYDIDEDIVYYACLRHLELLCLIIVVIILYEIVKRFIKKRYTWR